MRREFSSPRKTRLSAGRPAPNALSDGVVTLRLPEHGDATRLAEYGSSEELLADLWIGRPPRNVASEVWARHCIDEWLAGWTDQGSMEGPALIVDERRPFAGILFLVPLAQDVLELVYGVLPSERGRGIATRATRLAAEWALSDGQCNRVELRIGESNVASRRVAERAGFRFAERFETFVRGTGKTHVDLLYIRTR